MPTLIRLLVLTLSLALLPAVPASAQPSFVAFESGPVRPIAIAPVGRYAIQMALYPRQWAMVDVNSATRFVAGADDGMDRRWTN